MQAYSRIRDSLQSRGIALSRILMRIWGEILADDVLGRSAQLAYYFFFALFPFLISVIASLSLLRSADRGRTLIFQFLSQALPVPAFELISQTFDQILRTGGPLKMSVGIVVSIWSASMGMSAVMDTLNAAYKVRETRALLKQYLVAVQLTVAVAGLLIASIVAVIVSSSVLPRIVPGHAGATGLRVGEWLVVIALGLLSFAIVYHRAPDLKVRRWQWITPGAIAGVALLLCLSLALRAYAREGNSYVRTYGPFGAVIILLLSFYLSGFALLFGGVVNAILQSPSSPLPALKDDASAQPRIKL